MKLKGLSILVIIVAMCAFVASAFAPPTPFMIQGYVFYEDGSACNGSSVNITNQTAGKVFTAKTDESTNYYHLILANGTDVNASETLRFDARSPGGNQSRIFNYTVNETEINDGGIFDFNISLAAPTAIIFDTGQGTYPSIMGIHEGNFTPKCNITVHQIYTYSCAGTGGHSERVIFRDETGDTEIDVNWTGYQGDYHNITVPGVMLLENHVYNYTITTASYPQIIHNQTCEKDYGIMTCTRFVDANGREYDNWIPAIRLG